MNKLIISALFIFLMLSCNLSTENHSSLILKVKMNKETGISNEIKIMVTSVSDSRCPEGCDCIWAGEANVFFTLKDQGNLLDTNLIMPSKPKMLYKNYSIELKEVNPYPICNYQNSTDYTIQFNVEYMKKETL
jgi:hypothetical protein